MSDAAHIERARAVRVEDELARRGLSFWTRPRHNNLGQPCPICGGRDRFSVNTRKQVFNCRICGAAGNVIALVRAIDGSDFKEAVATLAGASLERTVCSSGKQPVLDVKKCEDNSNKAAWLWSRRNPITESCPAGLYLRKARGYRGPIPSTLGYLPANGKHPPAMIAAFGFCEEPEPGVIDAPSDVTGVHITRMTPDGLKAPEDKPKIMVGPMSGLAIVLAPINDGLGLAITEGIEDGLSVFEETGLGVWAAGSAGNMPKIAAALPRYVECVTIFAHCDETGLRFAKEAARLISARSVETHLKGLGFHQVDTPIDTLGAYGDD